MKCINCGGDCGNSPVRILNMFVICQNCEDARNEMANLFETGLVLEYSDGFKEVLKSKVEV